MTSIPSLDPDECLVRINLSVSQLKEVREAVNGLQGISKLNLLPVDSVGIE